MRPLPRRRDRAHSSPERSGRLGGRSLRRSLILIALCLVAASCGGAENEPNLAEAAERTEAQGTGRFEASGVQRADGRSIPVSCTGEADYEAKRVRLDCDYEAAGKLAAIAVGNDIYLRWPALTGESEKWVKMDGDLDDDTSLATLSPQRQLRLLRNASSETERVGEEDIRGEATVRYRFVVDCDAAKLDCESETPVDVWVADDGIVRRIAFEDDDGTATFEFFDFGADVSIEAPAAGEVVEGDLAAGSGSSAGFGGHEFACAEGAARPIAQGKLVETLRSHGFSMRETDRDVCLVDNVGDDPEATLRREGHVSCGVHAEPPPDAPTTTVRRGADGADAELALENVVCTIFTDSTTGEEKIAKLEAAFGELERALHP